MHRKTDREAVVEQRDGLNVQGSAEDLHRADFYGFIANLLAAPPNEATLARLCRLQSDDTPLGQALGALSATARGVTPAAAADEFNALFIGLTEGELRPYAASSRSKLRLGRKAGRLLHALRAKTPLSPRLAINPSHCLERKRLSIFRTWRA